MKETFHFTSESRREHRKQTPVPWESDEGNTEGQTLGEVRSLPMAMEKIARRSQEAG